MDAQVTPADLAQLQAQLAELDKRFRDHRHTGADTIKITTDQDVDINKPKDLDSVFTVGQQATSASTVVFLTVTNPAGSGKNLYFHGFYFFPTTGGDSDGFTLVYGVPADITNGTTITPQNMRVGSATAGVATAKTGSNGDLQALANSTVLMNLSLDFTGPQDAPVWVPLYSDLVLLPGKTLGWKWTKTGTQSAGLAIQPVWREQ